MKQKLLSLLISEMVFFSHLAASEIKLIKEDAFQNDLLSEKSPIPQGKLDPQILANFMPFILAEVTNEFAHQNDSHTRRDTRQYGFNFFKMLNGDFSYSTPPAFFQELGALICKALGHEPVVQLHVQSRVTFTAYY